MTRLRAAMLAGDAEHVCAPDRPSTLAEDVATVISLLVIGAALAFGALHVSHRTERLDAACVASGGHPVSGRLDYAECVR